MTPEREVSPDALAQAAARGMSLAYHAGLAPERIAVRSAFGQRTFGELNRRTNQLARRLLAAGIGAGDGVALLAKNRPEFIETLQAALRIGARITPINWHLGGDEVAYIAANCEAKALITDGVFAEAASAAVDTAPHLECLLAVDGSIPGFDDYDTALAELEPSDIEHPVLGSAMLYTSGTTGQPKGVYRKPSSDPSPLLVLCRETASCNAASDTALVTGPLYHAAPLGLNLNVPLGAGVGVVLMDSWDAQETLNLIERYAITHTHMVPTMFHRMLALPDEVKAGYDLSSLRWLVHGAAPCPIHIKHQMIEWLGPVLYEYYAATEGGTFFVDSQEWLEHPGTVGRTIEGTEAQIQDDGGRELGPDDTGTIYFRAPENRFGYFKETEKTASAYRGDFFTMGDMGYVNGAGYLFLTGRSAETIIAGGVNIYPQEVDDVVSQHPAVYEVCTVGVPNDEWGESVASVVELQPDFEPTPELAQELLAFATERLPRYKRPRSIDFARDLPRLPTGKIVRHEVRAPYWAGRDKSI